MKLPLSSPLHFPLSSASYYALPLSHLFPLTAAGPLSKAAGPLSPLPLRFRSPPPSSFRSPPLLLRSPALLFPVSSPLPPIPISPPSPLPLSSSSAFSSHLASANLLRFPGYRLPLQLAALRLSLRWLRARWRPACLLVCLTFAACLRLRSVLTARELALQLRGDHLAPAGLTKPAIYIVEEHQEALFKWLADALSRPDAAQDPLLLLHIDAHPDTSLPKLEGLSFGRMPANWAEFGAMIDRNDEFINAAAYAGFIDRLVFLRPSWPRSDLTPAQLRQMRQEIRTQVAAGRFTELSSLSWFRKSLLGAAQPCECQSELSGDNTTWKLTGCYQRMDVEIPRNSSTFASCSEDKSALPVRVLNSELSWMLSETGTNLLASSGLLRTDHFILDIDLDFLAVQLPTWPLYLALGNSSSHFEAAMHWVNDLATFLLCPAEDTDEAAGSAAFSALLRGLEANCGEPCDIDTWSDEQLSAFAMAPALATDPRTVRRLLCHGSRAEDSDSRASVLKDLRLRLRPLASLGRAVLSILRRIGICLDASPWNRRIQPPPLPPPQLLLCTGANSPFDSAVVESPWPPGPELLAGLRQLGDFLDGLGAVGLRPRLVTVARSGRDGYTPRALLGNLTQSVVGMVRSAFRLPPESVVMDAFLYRPA